jgi:hypothetical protein
MSPFARICVSLSLALAAPAAAVLASPGVAQADEARSDLSPGVQLMAIDNVTLHRAEIAKGSRVSVAEVVLRAGKLDGVSLELADGHIVKVGVAMVRSHFTVVDP